MLQGISANEFSKLYEKVPDFRGVNYPKTVVLHVVFFHARYRFSYRDLEEILAECSVKIDLVTLKRWVIKFSRAP